ncbi:hypothetical protein PHLCEN_2v11445, partial [Hermanssonia centrifuga]
DILSVRHGPRNLPVYRYSSRDLSYAAKSIINSGYDTLGLSIELSDEGQVKALAFATVEEVYHISFKNLTPGGKRPGKDLSFFNLLSGRRGLLAGFSMARIALHMHRELGYHVSGIDLSTLFSKSTRCPWYPAKFLSMKVDPDVDSFRVNDLWCRNSEDELEALERMCLKAWISAK